MAGKRNQVALFTGAWIEIVGISNLPNSFLVALFTGAWIEINRGN